MAIFSQNTALLCLIYEITIFAFVASLQDDMVGPVGEMVNGFPFGILLMAPLVLLPLLYMLNMVRDWIRATIPLNRKTLTMALLPAALGGAILLTFLCAQYARWFIYGLLDLHGQHQCVHSYGWRSACAGRYRGRLGRFRQNDRVFYHARAAIILWTLLWPHLAPLMHHIHLPTFRPIFPTPSTPPNGTPAPGQPGIPATPSTGFPTPDHPGNHPTGGVGASNPPNSFPASGNHGNHPTGGPDASPQSSAGHNSGGANPSDNGNAHPQASQPPTGATLGPETPRLPPSSYFAYSEVPKEDGMSVMAEGYTRKLARRELMMLKVDRKPAMSTFYGNAEEMNGNEILNKNDIDEDWGVSQPLQLPEPPHEAPRELETAISYPNEVESHVEVHIQNSGDCQPAGPNKAKSRKPSLIPMYPGDLTRKVARGRVGLASREAGKHRRAAKQAATAEEKRAATAKAAAAKKAAAEAQAQRQRHQQCNSLEAAQYQEWFTQEMAAATRRAEEEEKRVTLQTRSHWQSCYAIGLAAEKKRQATERLAEEARLRAEEARLKAEKAETKRRMAERIEAKRQQAARQEAARLEAERAKALRVEAERQEAQRVEAQRVEAARVEAARLEAARVEAARVEAARLKAERLAAEKRTDEQRAAIEQRAAAQRAAAAAREQEAERQRQAANPKGAQPISITAASASTRTELILPILPSTEESFPTFMGQDSLRYTTIKKPGPLVQAKSGSIHAKRLAELRKFVSHFDKFQNLCTTEGYIPYQSDAHIKSLQETIIGLNEFRRNLGDKENKPQGSQTMAGKLGAVYKHTDITKLMLWVRTEVLPKLAKDERTKVPAEILEDLNQVTANLLAHLEPKLFAENEPKATQGGSGDADMKMD